MCIRDSKSITPRSVVTITKVKRGKIFQQAPLLYDLTALQKDVYKRQDKKNLLETGNMGRVVELKGRGGEYIPSFT